MATILVGIETVSRLSISDQCIHQNFDFCDIASYQATLFSVNLPELEGGGGGSNGGKWIKK